MKILWFASQLIESGGGEKFLFEIAKNLKRNGHEVQIVCDVLDEKNIYAGKYDTSEVINFNLNYKSSKSYLKKALKKITGVPKLYSQIKLFDPDLIICQSEFDSIRVKLAILFKKIPMRVFIFGQMFQFKNDISKYSYIFSKKLKKIIDSQPDYISRLGKRPSLFKTPITFISNEFISLLKYWSIRKSDKVFVLSNQVKREVELLYGVPASLLRGAISKTDINHNEILNPKPIAKRPVFISCCRLDEKKRVDVIIKAFIKSKIEADLVIIGDGPEMNALKEIAYESSKYKAIKFLGRVSDEEKDLNLQLSDVFISMDNSDFVISGIEAIAIGKRAILSNHFDIDSFSDKITGLKLINPSIQSLSEEFDNIYDLESPSELNIKALTEITWEFVSNTILD